MSSSRTVAPGQTSCLHLPGGTMTLQTELKGEPPHLVTIIDFRGKVVRRLSRQLSDEDHDNLALAVRRTHQEAERGIRASLRSLHEARKGAPPSAAPSTASLLFVMASEALHRHDRDSATALLRAVAQLLPNDRRVEALLDQVARG